MLAAVSAAKVSISSDVTLGYIPRRMESVRPSRLSAVRDERDPSAGKFAANAWSLDKI